eukprot:Plantae.Rhodophyta-Hildenbrandia_rubra.ctg909.p1 GENE.Plantae.Rhodophyta-Hildenbrandia_rubra.ctg909~~Plantae.Rhodophyta-Hildenbrandia_rubra.ctg909.p1  ORF type:complete len:571 (-),score=94.38 Plantae.Rhodophyta-Hildenbrandia_rubra.ctg909:911-2623(-)
MASSPTKSLNGDYGVYSTLGRRPYMEDYHSMEQIVMGDGSTVGLYGVYDGHGGYEVAAFASSRFPSIVTSHELFHRDDEDAGGAGDGQGKKMEKVLREAVWLMEEEVREFAKKRRVLAGTTVCFTVVRKGKVWCANVGDSRAVLSRDGKGAVALSMDHSPWRGDEKRRIVSNGGFVNHMGVNGVMTVSRALGDLDMKDFKHSKFPGRNLGDKFFIAEPEITETELSGDEEFLIIASDGLWGRVPNHAAVNVVRKSLRKDGNVNTASYKLARAAMREGSQDNITTLVVLLNPSLVQGLSVRGGSIFARIASSRSLSSSPPVSPRVFGRKAQSMRQTPTVTIQVGSPTSITSLSQASAAALPDEEQSTKTAERTGNGELPKVSSMRRFFTSKSHPFFSNPELPTEHTTGFVGMSDPTGLKGSSVRGLFRRTSRRSKVDLIGVQSLASDDSQDVPQVASSSLPSNLDSVSLPLSPTGPNEQSASGLKKWYNQKSRRVRIGKSRQGASSNRELLAQNVIVSVAPHSSSLPEEKVGAECEGVPLITSKVEEPPANGLATNLQDLTISNQTYLQTK